MASTYSPSLKLELIGNGDQSGTWGTTTNTNLGTLLEQAITGVQTITMVNADYTLSNLNGAADEARNAVLVVGGTNAAIRNVIAPAVEKLYVIRNNTVGGFAIVIKTSASTGVSIANGTTAFVYCDGSEFYLAVPPYASTNTASTLVFRDGSGNFAAGTITANLTGNASTVTTNANLTGAVTSVGNATSLGSFTSANLAAALTDETGTGANVFANSPTLVTPALGTPSSGTLTNCTGLPVTTGVSGLAAGIATFLATPSSANLAAALTDETGTGANVFANSPTLVTPNLGTPSTLVGTNITGTAAGLSIGGSAATATTATTATNATNATNQSGGTVNATTGAFSGVASFAAGSISAPSITRTGDTNTGIYFPAADNVSLVSGGFYTLLLSPGTILSNNFNAEFHVPVQNEFTISSSYEGDSAGKASLLIEADRSDLVNYPSVIIKADSDSQSVSMISYQASSPLIFGTAGVERMRINASGNLSVTGTVTATTFVGNLSGNATTASNALGYNQTWQDLSGSRFADTTYTNNTGRPIFISVKWFRDDGALFLTVDGLEIGATGNTAGPQYYTLTAVIPAGSTYSATVFGGGGTLNWYELR